MTAEATSFTRRDPRADPAWVVVDGGDRGIGAVAFGLGGKAEHENPRDQAAGRHDQGQGPWPADVDDRRATFTGR